MMSFHVMTSVASILLPCLLAFVFTPRAAEGFTLQGRVAASDGTPLEGVRVGVRLANASTKTDVQGAFLLKFNPQRPYQQDNTKTYEWIELDKDGYFGRTFEVKDLDEFHRPFSATLGPNPVTKDRAELTARMSMDHLLPQVPAPADFALISGETWAQYFQALNERKPEGRTEQVVFQAYVPETAVKARAIFLLTRHGIGSIDQPRIRAFADRNSVALASVKGNPLQRGFYPVSLIDGYVAKLGEMLHHPELARLPIISFGHSNGTGFATIFPSQQPDRVIGWISYHSGAAFHLQFPGVEKAPGLVLHGLIDPYFKNGQVATVKNLRHDRNAPVAMMLEANVAHAPVDSDQTATWNFITAFAEAVMRIRLNEDGSLRPVIIEQGWLGATYDVERGGQQELAIAPFAEFKGDRSAANWLPDRTFAEVWQRYGKTDPRPVGRK
jgi:hypothetical protein